jgi:poly [ADP-ribose] polymerase
MSNFVREEYFVLSNIDNNNNKFWKIQELDNGDVVTTWGRVGDSGQSTRFSSLGSKGYDKKVKEKIRKGYKKLDTAVNTTNKTTNSCLRDIALSQIDADSQQTKKLIEFLTEVNVHNIIENTTIEYNKQSGVFTTPLGVAVSQKTINNARGLLQNIKNSIKCSDTNNAKLLTEQYLMSVPQNVGRGRFNVQKIFRDEKSFDKQYEILDSLESSLQTVDTTNPKDLITNEIYFKVKVREVIADSEISHIEELFHKTKQSVHMTYGYKISQVYSIEISDMQEAWRCEGEKVGNIMRLWHGTSHSNLLSILKKGLIIPQKYTNGWMFGQGLYFANQSTKSLNYAAGYWSGNVVKRCFMFLADVSLGNPYYPKSSGEAFPKPGYNSTFAKKGICSSILNDEIIVYKTSQANLIYLIEFLG